MDRSGKTVVTLTFLCFNGTIRASGASSLTAPGNPTSMVIQYSKDQLLLINKYSDQILELIDQRDDLTRSDLQGCCDAIVMNILREHKSL